MRQMLRNRELRRRLSDVLAVASLFSLLVMALHLLPA